MVIIKQIAVYIYESIAVSDNPIICLKPGKIILEMKC